LYFENNYCYKYCWSKFENISLVLKDNEREREREGGS
jgi:hypothetical protein